MKKTSQVKKRNRILVLIAIICLLVGGIGFYVVQQGKETLLVKKEVKINAHDPVRLNASLFLEEPVKDEEKIEIESPLMNSPQKYSYDPKTKIVTSKDKEYLEPGMYQVTLRYKNQEAKSKLIVSEAESKPKFIDFPSQINVEQNAKDFDLKQYFLATSKESVELIVPDLDIRQVGDQTVEIIAKSGQQETKESVLVHVLSAQEVANGETLTSMINGKVPLSQETWDALNNGDQTSIKISDVSKQIASILKQAKEGILKNRISYREEEGKDWFDPKTFTPSPKAEESKPAAQEPVTNDTATENSAPVYNTPYYPVYNDPIVSTPSDQTPTDTNDPNTPGDQTPTDQTPGDQTPSDQTAGDQTSGGTSDPGTNDPTQPSTPSGPNQETTN